MGSPFYKDTEKHSHDKKTIKFVSKHLKEISGIALALIIVASPFLMAAQMGNAQEGSNLTIGVSQSPTSVEIGTPATLTVTLIDTSSSPVAPTGLAHWDDGEDGGTFNPPDGFSQGVCELIPSSTTSSCSVTYAPPGALLSHFISVHYDGDEFHGSNSTSSYATFEPRATSLTVTPNTFTATPGGTILFNATVTDISPTPTCCIDSAVNPYGQVNLDDGDAGGTFFTDPDTYGYCYVVATPGSNTSSYCSFSYTVPESVSGPITLTAEYLGETDDSEQTIVLGSTGTATSAAVMHDTAIRTPEVAQIGAAYPNNILNLWSQLVDLDVLGVDGNPVGIAGKTLTVTTSVPATVTGSFVTGAGFQITSPSETAVEVYHCATMPAEGGSVQDCARDDRQQAGDNFNDEIRLLPGAKISFADFGTTLKQVNLGLTGNGKSAVVLKYTDLSNPDNVITLPTFITGKGEPDFIGQEIPSGVGQIEVVSVTQLSPGDANPVPGTLGIGRIVGFNAGASPPVRLDEDFETLSGLTDLYSLGSEVTLGQGYAYPILTMPDSDVTVTVDFAGDSGYSAPSPLDVGSQVIVKINADQNANSGLTNPTSDTGISSSFTYKGCAADTDKDGLCDADEDNRYISTSAGNFYICPGVTVSSVDKNPCGLNKLHKDLLIEVDCYVGRCPTAADTAAMKTSFANLNVENPNGVAGVNLVVQVSDTLTPSVATPFPARVAVWTDLDSSNFNDADHIFQIRGGTATERGAIANVKDNPLLRDGKFQIYHYGLIVPVIGATSGNTVDCSTAANTAFGVSEDPPGNQFVVAFGCSTDGASDPLTNAGQYFAGLTLNLGNQWQLRGIFMHELGHNIGLHHNGPVKAQNLWNLGGTTNPLTATTAVTGGTASVTKTLANTATFSGTTVATPNGKWEGYLKMEGTVTLTGTTGNPTITVNAPTSTTSPTGTLNMDKPLCTISSGSGTNTQTLSCYWSVRTAGVVSTGASMGVWNVPMSPSSGSVSAVALKAGTPAMTSSVPSIIYTRNCEPKHTSVMSYALQEPKLVDSTNYYSNGVFNAGYTPLDWNRVYTNPFTSAYYSTLDERSLVERNGLREAYYTTAAQKIVYAHWNAGQTVRIVDTSLTYLTTPVTIDWNGDSLTGTIREDINNLGIAGCGATANEFSVGTLAETKNINLIFGSGGGMIDSLSSHGDESPKAAQQTLYQATANSGFLQPVNANGHISGFKAGSTIPLKIIVRENNVVVPNLTNISFKVALLTSQQVCNETNVCDTEVVPTDITPTSGTKFTWDGQQYKYNWSTKGLSTGTYRVYAMQGTASIATVDVVLK